MIGPNRPGSIAANPTQRTADKAAPGREIYLQEQNMSHTFHVQAFRNGEWETIFRNLSATLAAVAVINGGQQLLRVVRDDGCVLF